MLAREDGAVTDPWERLAPRYGWQEPLERRSLAALVADLDVHDDEVLLDLGTGTGHVLRRLTATGRPAAARSVAVDRSRAMLSLVAAPSSRLLRVDAVRLPLADRSLDVVTAAWLLHLLTPDGRASLTAEVARVLRPGGRFGVVVPAPPRTAVQRAVRAVAERAATGLGAYRVPQDLPTVLAGTGFRVRSRRRTRGGYLADVIVAVAPS